jgi:hypothetical protein
VFGDWSRSSRKRCSGRLDESRGPIDRLSLSLNLILGRYFLVVWEWVLFFYLTVLFLFLFFSASLRKYGQIIGNEGLIEGSVCPYEITTSNPLFFFRLRVFHLLGVLF